VVFHPGHLRRAVYLAGDWLCHFNRFPNRQPGCAIQHDHLAGQRLFQRFHHESGYALEASKSHILAATYHLWHTLAARYRLARDRSKLGAAGWPDRHRIGSDAHILVAYASADCIATMNLSVPFCCF